MSSCGVPTGSIWVRKVWCPTHASPPTPFTVAVIDLVGGPVIKAIVAGGEVRVGVVVEGVLVEDVEDPEGTVMVDLQFRVVT